MHDRFPALFVVSQAATILSALVIALGVLSILSGLFSPYEGHEGTTEHRIEVLAGAVITIAGMIGLLGAGAVRVLLAVEANQREGSAASGSSARADLRGAGPSGLEM